MPTYIFGYGSIINNESRANSTSDAGACFVRLTAGYVREWSFRSSTGFTALGVRQVAPSDSRAIAGVLVAVDSDLGLAALDAREVGYRCEPRVPLSLAREGELQVFNSLSYPVHPSLRMSAASLS